MHDIFISYSHLDNQRAPGRDTGWVEAFERSLEVDLEQRVGRDVDVWRDPSLTAGKVLDRALESELARSKILVSLISPGYLRSPYCQQELAYFVETVAANGPEIGDAYSRVIPVLLNDIPQQDWPEPVSPLLAQPFHDGGRGGGRPLRPDSPEFEAAIDALVVSLADVLRRLEDVADGRGPPARSATDDAPSESKPGIHPPGPAKRKAYVPTSRRGKFAELVSANGPRVILGVTYLAVLTLLSFMVGRGGEGAAVVNVAYPLITVVFGGLTALTGMQPGRSLGEWLLTRGWILFAFGLALGLMLPLLGVLDGVAVVFALVTGVLFLTGAVLARSWHSIRAARARASD